MSEKYTDYKRKFNEEKYDRIYLSVPKGKKETIKEYAESKGESVNGFINRVIDEDMEKNNFGSLIQIIKFNSKNNY